MSAEALAAIAVALGAGWASGLNAYAAVLVLGGAERLGLVSLPHDLQVLASPWVLGVAALLFALNFFADKIPLRRQHQRHAAHLRAHPGRRAAGLSARPTGSARRSPSSPGCWAAPWRPARHIAKTGTRALINTSPEPFSNIAASLAEDSRRDRRPGPGARPSDHVSVPAGRSSWPLLVWLLPKLRASGADAVPPHGRKTKS